MRIFPKDIICSLSIMSTSVPKSSSLPLRRIPPRPISVSAIRDEKDTSDEDEDEEEEEEVQKNGIKHEIQGDKDGDTEEDERKPSSKFNTRSRKIIKQKIEELGSTAHMEIFRKLKREHVDYTRNKNGMFINLSVVHDTLLEEISAFVDYCIDNDRSLEEYDKKLNECKMNQRFDDLPTKTKHESQDNNNYDDSKTTGGGDKKNDCEEALECASSFPHDTTTTSSTTKEDHSKRKCGNGKTSGGANKNKRSENVAGEDAIDNNPTVELSKEDAECMLRLKLSMPFEVEKNTRRRVNTKFSLAKKRFGKKKNVDKRSSACDVDPQSELQPEPYIFV